MVRPAHNCSRCRSKSMNNRGHPCDGRTHLGYVRMIRLFSGLDAVVTLVAEKGGSRDSAGETEPGVDQPVSSCMCRIRGYFPSVPLPDDLCCSRVGWAQLRKSSPVLDRLILRRRCEGGREVIRYLRVGVERTRLPRNTE